MNVYDVIKRPLVTEKTSIAREVNRVIALEVARESNKIEIKDAVQRLFNVQVADVKTVNVAGKVKRVGKHIGKRSNWKKAYVTLKEGSSVDFFEV
jgi:large subunit ribosomal protein L23